jgi:nicotinamidase-related amidase
MRALIIIDVQKGLIKRKNLYNERLFFDSINSAIKEYRASDSKIVFVQHNNNQLKNGNSDWEIDERISRHENEIIIQKNHGNAFQNTNLKKLLSDSQIDHLIICGLTSHGCVKATCLGGIEEGFTTSLLKNGHTNWNKDAVTKISETEKEVKYYNKK